MLLVILISWVTQENKKIKDKKENQRNIFGNSSSSIWEIQIHPNHSGCIKIVKNIKTTIVKTKKFLIKIKLIRIIYLM